MNIAGTPIHKCSDEQELIEGFFLYFLGNIEIIIENLETITWNTNVERGGVVVQWVALSPLSRKILGFESWPGRSLCVELACCLCGFPPGTPVSSYSPKECICRLTGNVKMPIDVTVGVKTQLQGSHILPCSSGHWLFLSSQY